MKNGFEAIGYASNAMIGIGTLAYPPIVAVGLIGSAIGSIGSGIAGIVKKIVD